MDNEKAIVNALVTLAELAGWPVEVKSYRRHGDEHQSRAIVIDIPRPPEPPAAAELAAETRADAPNPIPSGKGAGAM